MSEENKIKDVDEQFIHDIFSKRISDNTETSEDNSDLLKMMQRDVEAIRAEIRKEIIFALSQIMTKEKQNIIDYILENIKQSKSEGQEFVKSLMADEKVAFEELIATLLLEQKEKAANHVDGLLDSEKTRMEELLATTILVEKESARKFMQELVEAEKGNAKEYIDGLLVAQKEVNEIHLQKLVEDQKQEVALHIKEILSKEQEQIRLFTTQEIEGLRTTIDDSIKEVASEWDVPELIKKEMEATNKEIVVLKAEIQQLTQKDTNIVKTNTAKINGISQQLVQLGNTRITQAQSNQAIDAKLAVAAKELNKKIAEATKPQEAIATINKIKAEFEEKLNQLNKSTQDSDKKTQQILIDNNKRSEEYLIELLTKEREAIKEDVANQISLKSRELDKKFEGLSTSNIPEDNDFISLDVLTEILTTEAEKTKRFVSKASHTAIAEMQEAVQTQFETVEQQTPPINVVFTEEDKAALKEELKEYFKKGTFTEEDGKKTTVGFTDEDKEKLKEELKDHLEMFLMEKIYSDDEGDEKTQSETLEAEEKMIQKLMENNEEMRRYVDSAVSGAEFSGESFDTLEERREEIIRVLRDVTKHSRDRKHDYKKNVTLSFVALLGVQIATILTFMNVGK